MLDLNQIHLFVQIVKAGSFAGAARRLGIPTNTVSRHIRQLEQAADLPFLHRSTRKITLTAAGHAFYERCTPSIEDLSRVSEETLDAGRVPSGVLRVAAPAGFFDILGIKHTAEFLSLHPSVRLEFVLDDAKTDLIAESIDVAFRSGRLIDSRSSGTRLVQSHSILAASPAYIKKYGSPASPQALSNHACIPLARDPGRVQWRLDGPGGSTEVTVSGSFRANTAQAVMQAAVAGLGIALLPYPLTVPALETRQLVRVLDEYRQEGISMHAIVLSRRQTSRAVAAFVEFMSSRLLREAASWNEPR